MDALGLSESRSGPRACHPSARGLSSSSNEFTESNFLGFGFKELEILAMDEHRQRANRRSELSLSPALQWSDRISLLPVPRP